MSIGHVPVFLCNGNFLICKFLRELSRRWPIIPYVWSDVGLFLKRHFRSILPCMDKINQLLSGIELLFLLFTVFLFTVLLTERRHSVFCILFNINSNRIYHILIYKFQFLIHNFTNIFICLEKINKLIRFKRSNKDLKNLKNLTRSFVWGILCKAEYYGWVHT